MQLFKSEWLQEPPRHVAGPYRGCMFAPRYRRRAERRPTFDPAIAMASNDDADTYHAVRELLRRMEDYDIAA